MSLPTWGGCPYGTLPLIMFVCHTGHMLDTVIHKWLKVPYTLHVHMHKKAKHSRAVVLFIHGLGNTGSAWNDVIKELPDDLTIISIDLLGFGKSPRPSWATYSTKTQAKSVIATLIRLRLHAPVIIVGHSLGSLVAVEIAKRYPLVVRSLILCSPPFYKMDDEAKSLFPNGDRILRKLFKYSKKHPEHFMRIAELVVRYGLVNASFNVTSESIDVYMEALEASIINQTSLADAKRLGMPMIILAGLLDPVVIRRNLKQLTTGHDNRKFITIATAGHEVRGLFVPAVVNAVESQLKALGK